MTTETFALLSSIGCLTLGAGCVTLFILWVAEGREVEDLRKSKEDLRKGIERLKREKREQRKKLTAEIHALRTQLHQLRKEQQKQDNQTHKAMTKEPKEKLTAWCLNLLVTYRIDFFRGLALSYTVNFLKSGDPDRIEIAIESLRVADNHDFEPDPKGYTELLRELREISKEVPLSDTAQSAITYVFGGEWEESIEALDKLKSERN